MKPRVFQLLVLALLWNSSICFVRAELLVGAAATDISPRDLPVLINGGMFSRTADELVTPLHARSFVLANASTRIAIVTVDSCMMPRELLDEAKALAMEETGIPTDHILISATHAHSVPSTCAILGTAADENYTPFLKRKIVESIAEATKNLEPAAAGWAVADAGEYTAVRRWIRRPDRMLEDPFGNLTVKANMHPGYLSPEATGPSGPEDPDLSVIAFRSLDGRPLALLANFSMHYYGAPAVSADYFGLFSEELARRIGPKGEAGRPAFVAAMSHGASGDIWLRDYLEPEPEEPRHDINSYTNALVEIALDAYRSIRYREDVTLEMAEAKLPLRYRTPNRQRLEWARRVLSEMEGPIPSNRTEVYAREAIILDEKRETELVLQAVRIGDLGLAAIPNEVYALSGLKLKALCPLQPTITIDLANGAEGYIPPPEQHVLGGYNTWPARSAGLEVQAEPKIVETVLGLLEKVAHKPRRLYAPTAGPAAEAILEARPHCYWRMEEFAGPRAEDAIGGIDAVYEAGVVFYLEGPHSDRFRKAGELNRASHFAGGRMRANVRGLRDQYTLSLWLWNGMPNDAREVTGYFFSRGRDHAFSALGDHLGIGGTGGHPGKLIFSSGESPEGSLHAGETTIRRWDWNHVALVRDGEAFRVYLNGRLEMEGRAAWTLPVEVEQIFIGGRNDGEAGFEGRIDEVALFDRALDGRYIRDLFQAASTSD